MHDVLPYWFTRCETSFCRRTGARVINRERPRIDTDRPGKNDMVWEWYVYTADAVLEGVAQNQKGARAAARRVVRTLPDSPPHRMHELDKKKDKPNEGA